MRGQARPTIADVRVTPMRMQPGDRILVKTYRRLDPDESRKLRRGIEKWAGCAVEVLIVNTTAMELEVERNGTRIY